MDSAYPTAHSYPWGLILFAVLAMLGTFGFASLVVDLPSRPGNWLGLAMCGYFLYGSGCSLTAERDDRLILLYERGVPGTDTFLSGHALARNGLRLDAMARRAGAIAFSDFGFPDPLVGVKVFWLPARDGLATVNALIGAVDAQCDCVDNPSAVLQELVRLREGLQLAELERVRFSFLIETGNCTSELVWERRGGRP